MNDVYKARWGLGLITGLGEKKKIKHFIWPKHKKHLWLKLKPKWLNLKIEEISLVLVSVRLISLPDELVMDVSRL